MSWSSLESALVDHVAAKCADRLRLPLAVTAVTREPEPRVRALQLVGHDRRPVTVHAAAAHLQLAGRASGCAADLDVEADHAAAGATHLRATRLVQHRDDRDARLQVVAGELRRERP